MGVDSEVMSLDEILQDPYYLEQFNKKISNMADEPLNKRNSRQAQKGGNTMENKDTDTNQDNNQTDTQPDIADQKQTEQTYSKGDYDAMAVKQYNAGITKAMKDAGFTGASADDFKKSLKDFKVWQDSQKTELEKAKEIAEILEKERKTMHEELATLKQQAHLQKQGVPADMVEFLQFKIGKLVKEGTDFETECAKYLKENPLPEQNEGGKQHVPSAFVPNQGGSSGNQKEFDMNKILFGGIKRK